MDSMRSLNKSLPRTSPSKGSEQPESLLQAFKNAALSVTTLYKTAAADQARVRAEGYQDALDELLTFLDKENIGLSDGEGWMIRRWATERLDGAYQHADSEDEGEKERGSSPVMERTQATAGRSTPIPEIEAEAEVESEETIPVAPHDHTPPRGAFTFRSDLPYPQDADMNESDAINTAGQAVDAGVITHGIHNSAASITITRPPRTSTRHNRQEGRHIARTTTSSTRSSSNKRKLNFNEFFDIGNLDRRDGPGGGGKRTRFT
jgi:hypothetical protein